MAKRDKTDWIVVHCAWTRPDQDIGRAEIDKWHRARGWDGIGYHFVIRRDGRVEPGRHLARKGAHCPARNADSVAVCLVGGMAPGKGKRDEDNFTARQKESLAILIKTIERIYPGVRVGGHADFDDSKTCPVMDVAAFMRGVTCHVTMARR